MLELGSAFESFAQAQLKSSVSVGFVVDTFFGPAFVGAALGNGGAFQLYFSVGRLYR